MKIFIKKKVGLNTINLDDINDYMASGGEGSIYAKGSVVYKIYHDPKKMIPYDKIIELKSLETKPNILIPLDLVLDAKSQVVGFTMSRVLDTVPLCKLFTNGFRNKNGVTPKLILELVETLQKDIQFIHKKDCLIVDLNELSFLVDGKFVIPYFIDVNSYQTPHFPASALMPSVKDWHTKGFSELTDWFAFGIVACQLFVGTHPYKGMHPNYTVQEMERRMKDNVSIFNPKVSVNAATRDFNLIPVEYKNWFIDMFEKGKRTPPPLVAHMQVITPVVVKVVDSTGNFVIEFIREYKEIILDYWTYNGSSIAVLPNKVYIDKVEYDSVAEGLVFTPKTFTPLTVNIENGQLVFRTFKGEVGRDLPASELMVVGNTIFCRWGDKFREIGVDEWNDKIYIYVKNSWNVMPNSTQVFDGCIYQDVLGKAHLMIPFKGPNGTCCSVLQVKELQGYQVIDAKQQNQVCVIKAVDNNGRYDRFILKFSDDYSSYVCRIVEDVGLGEPNFVVLSNGVCVAINENDEIEIFHNSMKSDSVKIIRDPVIKGSMKLYKDGVTVLFADGRKIYKISMKK
jgi:hypothetical protein